MSSQSGVFNLMSKMLQPINVVPRQVSKRLDKMALSKGHKLMTDLGIIRGSSTGIYNILPMGMRSLEKLRTLVKYEMSKIHAQEVKLPHITDSSLWKKSGRWNNEGLGMFTLTDRHQRENILSPTNEEVAADLMASIPQISHHNLPLLLYQISVKFRDELKPRCGLLKSKEFEMKDLYSFDKCVESAKETYEIVAGAYDRIFKRLDLPVIRAQADPGDMGGIFSHEYHICSDLGEDVIIKCDNCGHALNSEQKDVKICESCKSESISRIKGIEVGHTFLLGTIYSEPLGAVFKTSSDSMEPLVMASYGLGLTRILAAGVEFLSSDNDHVRWPTSLAPFSVLIIPPKSGSKEYETGKRLSEDLYNKLNSIPHLCNDVIIDDRENMTIGKRLLYAKRTGYPIILILGAKVTGVPPICEVMETKTNSVRHLTFEEIIDLLSPTLAQNKSCRAFL